MVQSIDFVLNATQIDDPNDRDCNFTANYDVDHPQSIKDFEQTL